MTRRANYATTACAVMLALALAACGSDSTPTGDSGTTANITFKTDPAATVWIDGENKGTTPIVIAVDAGSREVVLKADGFEDMKETLTVEAGKDLTVDTGLMLAGTDVADYKRLLATLGIDHEPYGEAPKAHRGGNDQSVMLYWPQATMRKASLGTYRIEVTPDYENDGYIVFRKGSKEIHREKFEAEDLITERALPAKVLESLKPGGKYSWGVYFDSRRKKPIVAKFRLASKSKERQFAKKIAKIQRRKTYQSANPLMRSMANIDLLRDNRYYSEALTHSLSVLNTWPTTEMPFRSIAFCLERLKLKETTLYEQVGEALRGSGVSARRPDLNAVNRNNAKGGQTSSLPPSLVAPRVREQQPGVKPGGMGVTPTPDAQKRQPGPIVPEDDGPGAGSTEQPVDPRTAPRANEGEIQDLKDKIADAETRQGDVNEAMDRYQQTVDAADAMQQKLDEKRQELETAQGALKALQDQEAATPGSVSPADMQAAEQAAGRAQESVDRAEQEHARLDAAKDAAAKMAAEVTGKTGTQEDLRAELENLKRELEALESESASGVPGSGVPGSAVPGSAVPGSAVPGSTPSTDPKLDPTNPKVDDPSAADYHHEALESAQASVDSARQAAELDGQWLADAESALNQARMDVENAERALADKIEAGGTPAEIEALEQAHTAAGSEAARAQMEFERARAAGARAAENLRLAQAELEKVQSHEAEKK